MSKMLCILLWVIGATIQTGNLYRCRNILVYMSRQAYAARTFKYWVYSLFFHILLLFLSYLVVSRIVARLEFRPSALLIAAILFLFSLLALRMVRSTQQKIMKIWENPFEVIHALIPPIEAKDKYTMVHSKHVMQLCELIYQEHPNETRSRINLQMLKDAALPHVIGKLCIPGRILQKPGHLDDAVGDTYSALSTDRGYHSRLDYSHAVEIMLDAGLVHAFCHIDREAIDSIFPQFDPETLSADLQALRQAVYIATDQLGVDMTIGGAL